MSSLWTPSGEHPVDRPGDRGRRGPVPGAPPAPPPGGESEPTAEERAAAEEYARQLDEARAQLVEAPAGLVVGQQALQFYELAALHLSQPQPRLEEARVAIDALAAVVDKLGARLGESETPLRQALHQLQLAFVEVSRSAGEQPSGG
ncbi:MAG TPA: DUF1844 domain-containing protein [Acidimicrobiales bacterium]